MTRTKKINFKKIKKMEILNRNWELIQHKLMDITIPQNDPYEQYCSDYLGTELFKLLHDRMYDQLADDLYFRLRHMIVKEPI